MVTTRHTRQDVISAAGRLFAERGYHGTSMRELGKELGLLGSSLYAHVDSKQDLLVAVVESGSALFEESAAKALDVDGTALERMHALIHGHVDVVLDNLDVSRTFLNEARMLDEDHRSRIIDVRDHYEKAFRSVIRQGVVDGSFRADADPKTCSIFILSILNAVERWYDPKGDLNRRGLVEEMNRFVHASLR